MWRLLATSGDLKLRRLPFALLVRHLLPLLVKVEGLRLELRQDVVGSEGAQVGARGGQEEVAPPPRVGRVGRHESGRLKRRGIRNPTGFLN